MPAQPQTLRKLADLQGHAETVWNLAWNPKKSLLASCSTDKDVRLYSYKKLSSGISGESETVFRLEEVIPSGHKRTVRCVSWSPTGDILATSSFDSTVGLWEHIPDDIRSSMSDGSPDWECFGTLEGHESECKSVSFSYNGNFLASCGRDKSVWIWEVHPDADFECAGVLIEHTQDVKTVKWHPKEEILASASYDNTIKLYIDDPYYDWVCYDTLEAHDSTVWSLSFSPCGRYLASASDDLSIWIWCRLNADDCKKRGIKPREKASSREGEGWYPSYRIKGHFTRPIYSVSWAAGDTSDPAQALGKIAAAGSDGKILIYYVVCISCF